MAVRGRCTRRQPPLTSATMRHRRVDRAILSESSSDPIDSEDQKLIISQFSSENRRTLRRLLRLLMAWIVAQVPVVTMVARPRLRPSLVALLVVANVLVLINGVFEFPEWLLRRSGAWGPGGGAVHTATRHVLSFRGVALLTAVVLVQLGVSLMGGPWLALLFLGVPLLNLLLVVYVRKSYLDTERQIGLLDQLRYKFKSA